MIGPPEKQRNGVNCVYAPDNTNLPLLTARFSILLLVRHTQISRLCFKCVVNVKIVAQSVTVEGSKINSNIFLPESMHHKLNIYIYICMISESWCFVSTVFSWMRMRMVHLTIKCYYFTFTLKSMNEEDKTWQTEIIQTLIKDTYCGRSSFSR